MDITSRDDSVPPALARGFPGGRCALRLIIALAVTPCGIEGQAVVRASVDSTHQGYMEAYEAYQETRRALDELTGRWQSLLDRLDEAQERRDEGAIIRLRPDIQELADEIEKDGAALDGVEREWYEAGRALIQIIGDYQLDLSSRLQVADEASQADLLREFNEMQNLRHEVEEQMGPREPLRLPETNIQDLPEDTPVDLMRKAASYRDYARKLDGLLPVLDEEIDRLERDRQREDQMRAYGRDPLGNRILPVRVVTGSGGAGADTTEVDLTSRTLAQQIEALRLLEEEVRRERDRFLAEADELERRAGGSP